ncbi:MAG: hypothetical protein COA45_08515 [Zetaproteobacteria bacterium]|nr:MAG: hypothetical protein COA45_08515 [Zetaproteobacteria bacterium]
MGTDKKYNQSDKVAEATLLDGLLSIGLYTQDPSPALNTLNDHLANAHYNLRANCIRKSSTQKEYNEKARALLHYFAPKYKDECTKIGALENSLNAHFIKNAPAPHKKTNTISLLFDKIADTPKPATTYTPAAPKSRPAQPTKKPSVEVDEAKTTPARQTRTKALKTTDQQMPLIAIEKPPLVEKKKITNPKPTDTEVTQADINTSGSIITDDMIKNSAELQINISGIIPSKKDKNPIQHGDLIDKRWRNIDNALIYGYHGLEGGRSLHTFMKDNRFLDIEIQDVVESAWQHENKYKTWPTRNSPEAIELPRISRFKWVTIDNKLREMGTTLDTVLKLNGCSNDMDQKDVLSVARIIKNTTGSLPGSNDTKEITIAPLVDERWKHIHMAFVNGNRGLPKINGGLPAFFEQNGLKDRPATKQDVIISAIIHKTTDSENKWPNQRTKEKIEDETLLNKKSWAAIDKRQIEGLTLVQIIKEYETHQELYKGVEEKAEAILGNLRENQKTQDLSNNTTAIALSLYALDQFEP